MTSLMKSKNLIKLAEKNVADGFYKIAEKFIQEAVSGCPTNQLIYGDAVNLLLEGGLYRSAKLLFERYQKETGEKLVSDFTLDDISEMEKASDLSSPVNLMIFKRMSLRKRGHFSNIFSFRPVKEIGLSENSIYVIQRGKKYIFSWLEVLSAQILIKDAFKSYGMGTAAKFTQKTFILETKEKTFQFDVSSNFPDFEYNDRLLKELSRKLKIKEVDMREKRKNS